MKPMNSAEKEFRLELIRILLQSDNFINQSMNQVIWKIAHELKRYKNTTYSDVWIGNQHIKKAIDELLKEYTGQITNHIRKQTKSVWEACEVKNDLLIRNHVGAIFVGNKGPEVSVNRLYKWFNRILPDDINPKSKVELSEELLDKVLASPRNTAALDAFLNMNRQYKGLTLSARVWNIQKEQFQPLIESYLADGVEAGKTAGEISREVRQYLDQPNKLFRRVRDKESGKLKLSKAAKAYHPGQGVYRSSYKNAVRLSRNEVNMAYRSADFERWQNLDFITGITVALSKQHPVKDICDELAGNYPKDFHFPSWHPQCLCHSTPILMPEKDFINSLNGEPVRVDAVTETPQQFNDWVNNNEARVNDWKNKPLFWEYNRKYVDNALNIKLLNT